jgi:predicted N-acetyltransferase YhbS
VPAPWFALDGKEQASTVATTLRQYRPESDFLRIRDMLARHYAQFGVTTSWRVERWVYARYFVAPLLGAARYAQTAEDAVQGIRNWESAIGVWEDDAGKIVAVVHGKGDGPGSAYSQRRPGADGLLDQMVDYAEEHLRHPSTGKLSLYVPDRDEGLRAAAARRGYEMNVAWAGHDSEFDCSKLPPKRLPGGFAIGSMVDNPDVGPRRKVLSLGFGHTDPSEWTSAVCYRELQRAPDYRPELDLFVVAPDGEYVSCCIAWYDPRNRIGALEPVCTHPDYRRRGMGREVVYEAIRRVAALGAGSVWVGTDKPFYLAIGFRVRHTAHFWERPA